MQSIYSLESSIFINRTDPYLFYVPQEMGYDHDRMFSPYEDQNPLYLIVIGVLVVVTLLGLLI